MTVVLDQLRWQLTDAARAHMGELGLALSEVIGVLENPQLRFPTGTPGEERVNGYGLTMITRGSTVLFVGIDGATKADREQWAVSRAYFRDHRAPEVEVAMPAPPTDDASDGSQLYASSCSAGIARPRRRQPKAPEAPVQTGHVLDRVHPALRSTIRHQVDGDFSRLVVHSDTRVEILPPRT